jgi:branched-chain amino acid transport system substrate-binding protein
VDAIVDVPTSSVGLAVNTVCREKNKIMLNSGTGTSDLTGPQCSPNTVHWTYDTYMLGKSTGGATVKTGGDSWFFVTADYVFGQTLQRDTANIVTKAGGKVLGSVAYPFPETTDFSTMLLRAQASGAKVLGLANAGADTENCIKQAHEFGLMSSMKVVAMLIQSRGVRALGLDVAAGLRWSESYYWNLNDRTRAWNDRVRTKTPNGIWPNMTQAGNYGVMIHYLKAVADMGVAAAKADGRATVARMKAMPTDDDCFGPGRIREDGRALHPVYLLEAKTPAESKHSWDVAKVIAVTSMEEAFRPLSEGHCPLVKA